MFAVASVSCEISRHPGPPILLQDLLRAVGQELLSLQLLSSDAQLVMSLALEQATLDAGQWRQAQSLDLITQRLEGLVTLTSALVEMAPQSWTIDAVEAVRDVSLGDLANRLLRIPDEGESDDPIELF